ncbi:ATP-binding protein [Salipiger sp. 1_MG-2023]|uniref:ATP-binding protein n=1 Tax=Salipiger sp. 1_MG-2023 TaxID=3062665 RepID=UPI0026E14EEC|nr:ATP-binding protein [Salipiger sp. 1_MG-2023]MDO6587891.1 ATP-binding protein [Salipiger sp. 1_MG-2023]
MTYPTARWLRSTALGAMMIAAGGMALADPFAGLGSFDGRIGASGPNRGPIVAGGEAEVQARGFAPGQPVTLRQGGEALAGSPFTADDEGRLTAKLAIPAGTAAGVYPVVVEMGGDAPYATTFDLKVSKELGAINTDAYSAQSVEIVHNPYQVAIGDGAVFVTGAVGRPPVKVSELAKLDPDTMEITARVTPPAAPARADGSDGGVFAVYGVGVAPGQVWVTNTRQNTVAVYSSDNLSLIKQFDAGTVSHPRDAVYHDGKVYVTATFKPLVHVFDTETLEELTPITLTSSRRGQDFATASLSLAPEAGKLFVSSLRSDEVAVIDLASGAQDAAWPIDGSDNTIGLAASPDGSRVYTVAQGNDTISVIDGTSGEVLRQVNVGANPLNAVVEPQSGNVFIALRNGHSVAVLDPEGELLANLDVGSTPNHLAQDGQGNVYVVNKSAGEDDPTAHQLTRLTAK